MSKKKFALLIVAFILVFLVVITIFLTMMNSRTKSTSSETSNLSADQSLSLDASTQIPLTFSETYQDSSGFSFKYPKEVTVKDVTPDDETYYSKVSLTKGSRSLTISIYDEPTSGIDSLTKNATLVGAAKLATIPVKQYSQDGKLLSVGVDKNIVYLLEGPQDSGFWEELHTNIIATFTLGTSTPAPAVDNSNTTYESEEVVE